MPTTKGKISSKPPKEVNPPMSATEKSRQAMETPDEAPDLALLSNWFQYAYDSSKKKHWEYFVIDQFLKGNQDIRANPDDNTIEVTKRKTDNVNFPINKMYSTFRAVRAFVTRHRPKVDVDPSDTTDTAKDYARRATKLIERDNQLNNGRRLNKEWAYYGVKYGIGYRQIGYDTAKKVTQRWTIDPFDMFIGAKTGNFEDAPYIIKSLTRTVGYWKSKFPNKNISPDDEIAASEYKRLAFQIQYQTTSTAGQAEDERTATAYECWYRLFKPNTNKGFINKVLFTKNEILDFQETPYTEYPFIAYRSEVVPNELSADGHMKHVVPAQRQLNLLNTQLLEYNHIVNRGRFQFPQGSGFRVVQAKEGQLIIHKPGKPVQVLNPPSLNPLLREQLFLTIDFLEDLGGQHDASMGSTPERVTSGRAIEQLQLGDSNNISDLRDNFEDALSQEAAWILKMYSLFEKDGVVINTMNGEKEDKFGVVGAEALGGAIPEKYYMEDNGSYCDVCAILPDNQVKVSVVSELGETKDARRELLFRLVELGLPLKTALTLMEFPNTDDIFSRIAEEQMADIMLEGMKSRMTQPPTPAPVPMPGAALPPEQSQELEALNSELEGMVNEGQ